MGFSHLVQQARLALGPMIPSLGLEKNSPPDIDWLTSICPSQNESSNQQIATVDRPP